MEQHWKPPPWFYPLWWKHDCDTANCLHYIINCHLLHCAICTSRKKIWWNARITTGNSNYLSLSRCLEKVSAHSPPHKSLRFPRQIWDEYVKCRLHYYISPFVSFLSVGFVITSSGCRREQRQETRESWSSLQMWMLWAFGQVQKSTSIWLELSSRPRAQLHEYRSQVWKWMVCTEHLCSSGSQEMNVRDTRNVAIKRIFSHYLITLMSFQTCMLSFFLWKMFFLLF